jgi:hypothetical protein
MYLNSGSCDPWKFKFSPVEGGSGDCVVVGELVKYAIILCSLNFISVFATPIEGHISRNTKVEYASHPFK